MTEGIDVDALKSIAELLSSRREHAQDKYAYSRSAYYEGTLHAIGDAPERILRALGEKERPI